MTIDKKLTEWKPEINDAMWYIDNDLNILATPYRGTADDKSFIESGEAYRTEQQARYWSDRLSNEERGGNT